MANAIKLLDMVALTVDLPEYNLWRGQVGTVVEILAGGAACESNSVIVQDAHTSRSVCVQIRSWCYTTSLLPHSRSLKRAHRNTSPWSEERRHSLVGETQPNKAVELTGKQLALFTSSSPWACVPCMRSCSGVQVPCPGMRGAAGQGTRQGVCARRRLKAAWNATAKPSIHKRTGLYTSGA
jgi:hypothetical protein